MERRRSCLFLQEMGVEKKEGEKREVPKGEQKASKTGGCLSMKGAGGLSCHGVGFR
jgi:hypothetical protein